MSIFSLLAIVFSVSALLGYINHRWLKLPGAIGVMLLSLLLGIALKTLSLISPETTLNFEIHLKSFDFGTFLMDITLCFLLFAGSLHVKYTELREVRTTVMAYATFGVIASTFLTALFVKLIFALFSYETNFITCLLFGALISPTDPIAVLGVISKYNIPKKLKIEIIGESLFNDGVGVIVFTVMYTIYKTGVESVTAGEVLKLFLIEAIGGVVIGILIGYIGYYLIKTIDHYQTEIIITLAIVMGGYSLANAIHSSGPLAMVVAGIFIGNKGKNEAMSDITAEYLDKFWGLIDDICNTLLFVIMGIEVFLIPFDLSFFIVSVIMLVMVLLSRFLSLIPPFFLFHGKSDKKMLSLSILTWGGLRGGISLALALSLVGHVQYSQLFLLMTYTCVVFSVLVQGLTMSALLKRY
jgi:monovalent cation:H+ antiporter, CPA1 family